MLRHQVRRPGSRPPGQSSPERTENPEACVPVLPSQRTATGQASCNETIDPVGNAERLHRGIHTWPRRRIESGARVPSYGRNSAQKRLPVDRYGCSRCNSPQKSRDLAKKSAFLGRFSRKCLECAAILGDLALTVRCRVRAIFGV
jgi:hypothetical protein